jgi:hypothetical protein
MRVGTKSVLFGAHCFFIHPFFVAVGWWIAWGFPWDPRLWAAFFLHDLGYLSCPNVEGPEGEEHVRLGAKIMGLLFGSYWAEFTLLGEETRRDRLKALLRGQTGVRVNSRLAVPPDGASHR